MSSGILGGAWTGCQTASRHMHRSIARRDPEQSYRHARTAFYWARRIKPEDLARIVASMAAHFSANKESE